MFKKQNILSLIPTKDSITNSTHFNLLLCNEMYKRSSFFKKILNKLVGKDLVLIIRFEDGKKYIYDGHYRLGAKCLVGNYFLNWYEYEIKDMTYSEYIDLNIDQGWITSIDFRESILTSNFSKFRKKAFLYKRDKKRLTRFVNQNQDLYKKIRLAKHANILGILDVLDKSIF